jgi:hypothetical protein
VKQTYWQIEGQTFGQQGWQLAVQTLWPQCSQQGWQVMGQIFWQQGWQSTGQNL